MEVDFEAMHVFPLSAAELEAQVGRFLSNKTYAAVVFGIGTWYN